MGMREDRKNAACATIMQCERLYRETLNPYFILDALSASHWGEFDPPKWALEPLLLAVYEAMESNRLNGADISIDRWLGVALTAGKKPIHKSAQKKILRGLAFDLVKTITTCFEVPISSACEIVYESIDYNFAQMCEDVICSQSPENCPHEIMEKEEWRAIQSREELRAQAWMSSLQEPSPVKRKIKSRCYWSITIGDRLDCGVDSFTDSYNRRNQRYNNKPFNRPSRKILTEGEFDGYLPVWREQIESGGRSAEDVIRLAGRIWALTSEQISKIKGEKRGGHEDDHINELSIFFRGWQLLNEPHRFARQITIVENDSGDRFRCKSSVSELKKRGGFLKFLDKFNVNVSK